MQPTIFRHLRAADDDDDDDDETMDFYLFLFFCKLCVV